jgi:RNA-splicing ligase RtcB
MPIEIVLNGRVPVKIWTDRIEPEAIEQLKNIASLPVVHPHVAAMPDVHLGKGATVGAVVPTKGAVCPAAVGVDIGCGMSARKTSIPSEALGAEDLKKLRHSIEREIPVGREHHNYVADEVHFGERLLVTRKGAIRAGEGDLGIIPGSMGTGTYIVRGLGSSEAFESAPHGAGRRMSRTQARRRFTAEDVVCQTEGVECRKDVRVVDEIPGAYKPIEEVIEKSSDLVEVVAFTRQVICVKG